MVVLVPEPGLASSNICVLSVHGPKPDADKLPVEALNLSKGVSKAERCSLCNCELYICTLACLMYRLRHLGVWCQLLQQ